MMQKICFFIFLILSQFVIANAQNSIIAKPAPVDTTLNQGLDFANKLLPLTPKQLVNPLGVNSSIWGNANTAIVLPDVRVFFRLEAKDFAACGLCATSKITSG